MSCRYSSSSHTVYMTVFLKDFNPETFSHFDGFEYATPLKDAWKCPVCKKLLKHPLQLGCGHRICSLCFEDLPMVAGKNKKLCPVDDEPIEEIYSDRSALLEIIKIEVYCPMKKKGCVWVGMIFAFLAHLNDCKFASSWKSCSLSVIGCDKKGGKNDLKNHRKEQTGYHLGLLAIKQHKISNKIIEANNTIQELSSLNMKISRQQENCSDCLVATDSASEGLHPRIKNIIDGLAQEVDTSSNMTRKFEELKEGVEPLSVIRKTKEISENLTSISLQIDAANMEIGERGHLLLEQNVNSDRTNSEEKVRKLEKERKASRVTFADIDLKTRLFQATTMDGKYIWKIDNFSRRMKEARENKITELYSPPLFTKMFGYKACGKLYPNGNINEEGYGTHVSFYAIVMKGDHDDLLPFPFPKKFYVKLLAHDGYHVEKIIVPSRSDPAVQKPTADMNPIVGYPKFVSHSELAGDNFIWDDSLYFKIDFTQDVA